MLAEMQSPAFGKPEVNDGTEISSHSRLHLNKKGFKRKSQAQPEGIDSSAKNNMVAHKIIDLMSDQQKTELDDANFQSCSGNAEFGNEDYLVPSEADNANVLADLCRNEETAETEMKENSSSDETARTCWKYRRRI